MVFFAIALFIVWLGFICVPAIHGREMLIEGIQQILDVPSFAPEYRMSELLVGIGMILYSLFLMSISVIMALLPFFKYF